MESVQVEIFGQTYSIKGIADRARIRELAAFVDGRMKDIQRGTGTADVYRMAILTALNIADELFRLRTQQEALQQSAERTIDRIIELTAEHHS
jgi:cell division protein ZapA